MLNKDKLEKYLKPKIEEPKEIIKELKLQHTGRQFILQIPAIVVEVLNLKKGDKFIIKVPIVNPKQYSIRLKKY